MMDHGDLDHDEETIIPLGYVNTVLLNSEKLRITYPK